MNQRQAVHTIGWAAVIVYAIIVSRYSAGCDTS